MRRTLPEIYAAVTDAGLRDLGDGFPLRAVMAAIAEAEGADPNAWVAHDPPSSETAPPSSGLYQVNRRWWPRIYEDTERVRRAPIPDRDKMIAMTVLVEPIIVDALQHARRARVILAERGIPTSDLQQALFVNAAWQAGGPYLLEWARRTKRGDPRELVNPERAIAVETSLRGIAGEALGLMPGAGLLLGTLVLLGLGAFALSQWKP